MLSRGLQVRVDAEIIPGSNARQQTDKRSLQFESNQRVVCRYRRNDIAEGNPWDIIHVLVTLSTQRQYITFIFFHFFFPPSWNTLYSGSRFLCIGVSSDHGSFISSHFCYNEEMRVFHRVGRESRPPVGIFEALKLVSDFAGEFL